MKITTPVMTLAVTSSDAKQPRMGVCRTSHPPGVRVKEAPHCLNVKRKILKVKQVKEAAGQRLTPRQTCLEEHLRPPACSFISCVVDLGGKLGALWGGQRASYTPPGSPFPALHGSFSAMNAEESLALIMPHLGRQRENSAIGANFCPDQKELPSDSAPLED